MLAVFIFSFSWNYKRCSLTTDSLSSLMLLAGEGFIREWEMCGCAICPPLLLGVSISVYKSQKKKKRLKHLWRLFLKGTFLAFMLLGRSVLYLNIILSFWWLNSNCAYYSWLLIVSGRVPIVWNYWQWSMATIISVHKLWLTKSIYSLRCGAEPLKYHSEWEVGHL